MAAPLSVSDSRSSTMDTWRYVIVMAKFMCHFLVVGLVKSLSVLIPSLVIQLDIEQATAGLLVSMQFGVYLMASPISHFLGQKFGSRLVPTVSCFLSAISLLAGTFSQTATFLGCSLFLTSLFLSPWRQISSEILHQHFGKGFGVATTISHLGDHLGNFLMPYLTLTCFDTYGLRGSLLILTAVMFHGVPMAATLRPPRHSEGRSAERGESREDDAEGGVFDPLQPCSSIADSANQTRSERFTSESTDLPTNMLKGPVMHGFDQDGDCEIEPLKSGSFDVVSTDYPESEGITIDNTDFISHRSNETEKTRNLLHSAYNLIKNVVHDIFSFAKKECVFTFLLLPCQVLFDISYCCWEVFVFSYGISEGLTKYKAAYLLVMGAVGGTIGRLLLIAVLYKHPLVTTHLLAFNLAISSFALLAYPINSSLTYLSSISFVAGFGFYASYSALFGTFPLKVQKGNFPKAVACSLMLCGTAYFLSGILAGSLYNMFGSYRVVFRILGISLAGNCLAISTYIFVDSVRNKKKAPSRLEKK